MTIGQEMIRETNVVIAVTPIVARMMWKYGQRGYRYVWLDAGHLGQNIYLAATALKMGAVAVGGFFDAQTERVARVARGRGGRLLLCVGHPDKSAVLGTRSLAVGREERDSMGVPSVFASQIDPILFNNCSGCHSTIGLANWFVGDIVATYNCLLTAITKDNLGKYIVPNHPGASRLYQRITRVDPAFRMPRNGPDLVVKDTDGPPDGIPDATEINGWINAGATGP